MLVLFDTSQPILFFPARWANSVTRWLTGIFSPDGTIDIQNTADPSDNGGCALSVNADAVYQLLKEKIAADFVLKSELINEIAARSDRSLTADGGSLHVYANALDISSGGGGGGGSTTSGYTGNLSNVPYNNYVGEAGTYYTNMYYSDGIRYTTSAYTATFSGIQILDGQSCTFNNGKLTTVDVTSVSSSQISITAGSFSLYFSNGLLKTVNGSAT